MGFHGSVFAGLIVGATIEGGTITGASISGGTITGIDFNGVSFTGSVFDGGTVVGTLLETSTGTPAIRLGPTVYGARGDYPAIQFIGQTSETTPAEIYYVDNGGLSHYLVITAAGSGYGGATILLTSSDDSAIGPNLIVVQNQVEDRHGNPVPSFQNITSNYTTDSTGSITFPHNFGTSAVSVVGATSNALNWRINAITSTAIVLTFYNMGSSSPVGAGVNVYFFGSVVNYNG